MLADVLNTETALALSIHELVGVLVALGGLLAGIVAVVRRLEREEVRGDMRLSSVETRQAELAALIAEQTRNQQTTSQQLMLLTKEVCTLTKEVSILTETLNRERRANRTARKPPAK